VELHDLQVGPQREQLRAAAQARGSDPGAVANLGERGSLADPDVGRVLAGGDADDREPVRDLPRDVLGAVDG